MKTWLYILWIVDPYDPGKPWVALGRAYDINEEGALEKIIESGYYMDPNQHYILTKSP